MTAYEYGPKHTGRRGVRSTSAQLYAGCIPKMKKNEVYSCFRPDLSEAMRTGKREPARPEVSGIKKYRNEWKYYGTSGELRLIGVRLDAALQKDIHGDPTGKYTVHSLYFDDWRDSCVRENDAGISERVKYRIRRYGKKEGPLWLERKEKAGGRCHKESCMLSLEAYRDILEQDPEKAFWQAEEPLLKRFCVRCMADGFVPKAVIDYERTAYVDEILHVRITLDENISVSDDFSHFTDGDYIRYPLLDKNQHVLEVKFDELLPGYVKQIVTERNLLFSSFSKYALGRKKLQSMGRIPLYPGVGVRECPRERKGVLIK